MKRLFLLSVLAFASFGSLLSQKNIKEKTTLVVLYKMPNDNAEYAKGFTNDYQSTLIPLQEELIEFVPTYWSYNNYRFISFDNLRDSLNHFRASGNYLFLFHDLFGNTRHPKTKETVLILASDIEVSDRDINKKGLVKYYYRKEGTEVGIMHHADLMHANLQLRILQKQLEQNEKGESKVEKGPYVSLNTNKPENIEKIKSGTLIIGGLGYCENQPCSASANMKMFKERNQHILPITMNEKSLEKRYNYDFLVAGIDKNFKYRSIKEGALIEREVKHPFVIIESIYRMVYIYDMENGELVYFDKGATTYFRVMKEISDN
jgi:hypothetical protein